MTKINNRTGNLIAYSLWCFFGFAASEAEQIKTYKIKAFFFRFPLFSFIA